MKAGSEDLAEDPSPNEGGGGCGIVKA